MFKLAFMVLLTVGFLAGCGTPLAGLLVTKSQKEKEISALQVEYQKKLADKTAEITVVKDSLIAAKDAQMRVAAGVFYGQDYVFKTILTPTRTDLVTHNLALEGWTALGNIMPTYEKMQEINQRLQRELDETRTSLADLQRNHLAAVAANQKLSDETKQWQDKLAIAERERTRLAEEFSRDLAVKQGELVDIQNRLIAAEKARSDEAKARQKQLAKLSWGAGILAALCLAGAIWSPISKRELALAAAVFGGAAVAIPFLEGWMVLAAVGAALAALVGWALFKHRKDERVADSLTLAMQDIKDRSKEDWAKIAPIIEDRLKVYRKKNGKLVAEKDPTIEAHIDDKLAEYEALGPVPSQPSQS